MEMLYEGKAKKIFKTEKHDEFLVYYKDDATAFNGEKKDTLDSKGIINNQISSIIFELLKEKGIESHFIKKVSEREMLVRAVEIMPLEVIIRNISAGSMAKRLGMQEGINFDEAVFEISYKRDDLGDPLINEDHAIALEIATREELNYLKKEALKINELMKEFFLNANLTLVDFKIEFGKTKDGKIILADEISPDTCRLWDVETKQKLDKDRFRRNMGGVMKAYEEVLSRLEKN